MQARRVKFIDEIRGLCILLMVLYHFTYDISNSIRIEFFDSDFLNTIRDIVAGIFILISGISCEFSKNNLRRGTKCVILGLIITLITYIFIPEQLIIFGILHMLGSCMIIYHLLQNNIKKVNKKISFIICVLLFVITIGVTEGHIGIGNFMIQLPNRLYEMKILIPFGIIEQGFYSADYFPLFPWIFLFLSGTIIGQLEKENKFPRWMYISRCKFLELCGRYTLMIYILHQPVIYFILYVLRRLWISNAI